MQNNNIQKPECDLDFLTRINTMLASGRDFSQNINSVLKLIGNHTGYDRIHIFEVRNDMSTSFLYEWCDSKLLPVKGKIKEKNFYFDRHLEQQISDNNYIEIHGTDELSNTDLKDLLSENLCKNIIVFPLFESGYQFAFIAFSQCGETIVQKENNKKLLQTLSSIIAAGLNKNILERKLIHNLSKTKRYEEEIEMLKTKILQLNYNLQATWEKEKTKSSYPSREQAYLPDMLEHHMKSLNQLCQALNAQ